MKRILTASRVLLTGASSGIGHALALELAKEGADLVVTARRKDRLDHLVETIRREHHDYAPESGVRKIVALAGDITEAAVRENLVTTVKAELGGLDTLVNNAGAGATSLIETTTEKTIRDMMELNYFALLHLTQLALPLLKESAQSEKNLPQGNPPLIVNLSSIVGLRGVPHYGAYGAAKFAVAGISETMRAEFRQHGIDVLVVCPGTTATEFFDVLHQSSSAPDMPIHTAATPEYVARKIARAIKSGKHKIIPYFQAGVLDYLNRFAPRFTDWLMTKYV